MAGKKYDEYIINELLPRYFEGNVLEEEYLIVQKWIG
jgi:hypothetical protein